MRSRFIRSIASLAAFGFVFAFLIGGTHSHAVEDTGVTLLNEQNGKIDAVYHLPVDQAKRVSYSKVEEEIEELIPTSAMPSSKDLVTVMNNPWGTSYQLNYFVNNESNWIQYNVTQRKTELTNEQFDKFKKPGTNRVIFSNEGEEVVSKVLLNNEDIYAVATKKNENWMIFWWTKKDYGLISGSLPMPLEDLVKIFNSIPIIHAQSE